MAGRRFATADCCVTIMATLEDALRDPHFVGRGLFAHKVAGPPAKTMPALPVPIDPQFRGDLGVFKVAPKLGTKLAVATARRSSVTHDDLAKMAKANLERFAQSLVPGDELKKVITAHPDRLCAVSGYVRSRVGPTHHPRQISRRRRNRRRRYKLSAPNGCSLRRSGRGAGGRTPSEMEELAAMKKAGECRAPAISAEEQHSEHGRTAIAHALSDQHADNGDADCESAEPAAFDMFNVPLLTSTTAAPASRS